MSDQISDYAYNYGDDESRYCDTGVLAMIFSPEEILASSDLSDDEKQSILERQDYIDQSMGATPEVVDEEYQDDDPTWGYQDKENKDSLLTVLKVLAVIVFVFIIPGMMCADLWR